VGGGARAQGGGPTLIELVTYRAAAHSTSDDPARYRPRDEWKSWPLGDPIERLREHLIALGEWSQERHAALEKELEAHVAACWKEAMSYGTLTDGPKLDPATMFDDVYAKIPPHLERQRAQLQAMGEARSSDGSGDREDLQRETRFAAKEG